MKEYGIGRVPNIPAVVQAAFERSNPPPPPKPPRASARYVPGRHIIEAAGMVRWVGEWKGVAHCIACGKDAPVYEFIPFPGDWERGWRPPPKGVRDFRFKWHRSDIVASSFGGWCHMSLCSPRLPR